MLLLNQEQDGCIVTAHWTAEATVPGSNPYWIFQKDAQTTYHLILVVMCDTTITKLKALCGSRTKEASPFTVERDHLKFD